MKRLILLLIAIFVFTASSAYFGPHMLHKKQTSEETAFCDCSGPVNWCWEIKANNTDITQSGGCADAGWDTTATAESSVSLTASPAGRSGFSIAALTGNDWYSFALPAGLADTWTIEFDVYITTFTSGARIFTFFGALNVDELEIRMNGTDELDILWYGNSSYVQATTAAANIQLNTWYTVTAKCRVGSTNPSLSISVNGSTGTADTDLTAWVADSNSYRIGSTGPGGYSYVKNIRIWNSWQ